MKVKNIMFSGFAAAIFAGVCGAADAATLNLASKQYVDDALETKASVSALTDVQTQVNTNASDIADLKTGKADASVIGTLGESATVTDYVDSAVQGAISDAVVGEGAVKEAIDTAITDAVAGKQDKLDNADVLESITADDIAAIGTNTTNITNLNQTVQSLNTTVEGKASTADVTALTERVSAAEADITSLEGAVAGKASQSDLDSVSALANAAATKTVVEALTGRVSTNEANISANTAAIEKLNAGVDVEGSVDYKIQELNDSLASTGDNVGALSNTVTAIDGRLTTAESDIEALQTATKDLGALAYKDTVSSAEIDDDAVTTDKIAGTAAAEDEMMLMSTGPDGVVTWTSVKVF